MILEKVYDELMAQIEDLKKVIAGGAGGSKDYDKLDNRPKVNNITLTGNKKSSDLKITYSMTEAEYAAATKNTESIYCLQENATSFDEEDETASNNIEWSASGSGYAATWEYTPSNQNFTGCTAVECDDVAITVGEFQVRDRKVLVFLSCEDISAIGETVTFTFTLTQPAGGSRIVKDGIEFGADLRSNTPIRIGTWIDGKPLYRVIVTASVSGQSQTVPLIPNTYKIVNFNAVVNTPSGTSAAWGYFNGAQDNFTGYIDSDNQARIVAGGVAGVCNFTIDFVSKD